LSKQQTGDVTLWWDAFIRGSKMGAMRALFDGKVGLQGILARSVLTFISIQGKLKFCVLSGQEKSTDYLC